MEGYISNIDVATQTLAGTDAAVNVSAKCCASNRKKRKHGVKIRMSQRGGEFHLVRCECECEAGEGERCSHVCGVLHYLAAEAAFVRDEAELMSHSSPTSLRTCKLQAYANKNVCLFF